MPDTADHRADMYRLSRERIAAGKPSWEHHINLRDVFHNDDLPFEQKRDAIIRRIRATTWFKDCHQDDDLVYLVEELAETEDATSFDDLWRDFYDIADADRVWIATF